MATNLIVLLVVVLSISLALGGLAQAGDRAKFPERRQGGSTHGVPPTEQVDRDAP